MFRGDRLKALLVESGISQSELARRIGVSQAAIWKLINEPSQGSKHTHRIAAELETTPDYLMDDTDDRAEVMGSTVVPRRLPSHAGNEEREPDGRDRAEIVWLKEVDQSLGAGGAFFDSPSEERLVPFPAPWLKQFPRSKLEFLVTMPCKGTSMEPTINDGNLCIIDVSRTTLDEQDEIWACAFGNLAVLKRLRAMPDGTVKMMSDNDRVSDEIAGDGELFILGRCVGILRSS